MRVQPRSVEGFLRNPDPSIRCLLVYGSDNTLVSERTRKYIQALGVPEGDPFRMDKLSADQILSDRALLADSAAAQSLTQESRLVLVVNVTDRATPVLEEFLDSLPGDATVVLEAGDLVRKRSSLVKLIEGHESAAAIACYEDDERDRSEIFLEMFRAANLRIEPAALNWLAATLDSNRGIARREVEKLCLLAPDNGTLTLDLVQENTAESGKTAIDSLVSSACSGDIAGLEKWLDRASLEGLSPVGMVRGLINQFFKMLDLRGKMASGMTVDAAVKAYRPPVFFKSVELLKRQVRLWPEKAIKDQLVALTTLESDLKSSGVPDRLICERHFYQVAMLARRRA